jgi:hypothetical protein
MGMDQYLLIPFLGNEHPITSYFDVHQGYKVLTHCHMTMLGVGFINGAYNELAKGDYRPANKTGKTPSCTRLP